MKIAVNPETGEQIVLQGGKWVPLQVAENPETGERLGLVDNQWQPLPAAEPKQPYQGTYGPLMDGLIEGIATVGSGVGGSIAGAVGGLWDAVTGEDYETARETQDRISGALTWSPVSDGGKEAVASIGEAMDNPLFNYLGETGEAWGQNTNDYLLDTPLAAAAPAAGILASMGPDIAAGVATGGAGAGAVRGGKALRKAYQQRKVAPAVLEDINSVGSARVDTARQNAALAQELDFPIPLTQGQATRNAAQMSDEYNLARSHAEGVAEPLAALQRNQQDLLYRNLENVGDSLDRADREIISSDEALGRSIKDTLERRRAERKEKTGALYQAAEEQGELDQPLSVSLDGAFAELQRRNFDLHEPDKMRMLGELADRTGVSEGRLATIRQVEDFRQNINRVLDDPTSSNQMQMAGVLKAPVDEALDLAPDSAEAYKRARASYSRDKTAFEGNALVTQLTSKKGRTESPAVADENVYRKILTAPMEDVRRMTREIIKTDGGVDMIHSFGSRLMDDIIKSATKDSGEFNSAAFKRQLDKIGDKKLEMIYGPERLEELRKISDVGTMINTMPFGNSANYSQSTNTLLKKVADVIGRGPILGPLVRKGGNTYNDWAQEYDASKRVKKALDLEGLLSYQ